MEQFFPLKFMSQDDFLSDSLILANISPLYFYNACLFYK